MSDELNDPLFERLGPIVLRLLALISVDDQRPPTANLLSPIVINVATRKAVQSIQVDFGYSHRHPLVSEVLEAVCS